MPEHPIERLIAEAAPAAPDEAALARVRERVLSGHRGALPHGERRTWPRTVAVAIAGVVIIGLLALALLPRGDGSDAPPEGPGGFVAARAAQALAPTGKILHVVVDEESTSGPAATHEHWFDVERAALRERLSEPGGRGTISDRVVAEGRTRFLWAEYAGRGPGVPESQWRPLWRVSEGPAFAPKAGPFYDWQEIRSRLASGGAVVTGEETVGGSRYWRVAMDWRPPGPYGLHVEALFRQPDYRPLTIERTELLTEIDPAMPREITEAYPHTTRWRVRSWELIARGDVPSDTLEPSDTLALRSVAATGAWEERAYEASQIAMFTDWDVFWVGADFEGLRLREWRPKFISPPEPLEAFRFDKDVLPGFLSLAEAGYLGPLEEYFPLFLDGPDRVSARMLAEYGGNISGNGDLFIASFPQIPEDAHAAALKTRWPRLPIDRGSADGRSYTFVRAGAPAGPPTRALVNLGDATVFVATASGRHRLDDVIAALKKAN